MDELTGFQKRISEAAKDAKLAVLDLADILEPLIDTFGETTFQRAVNVALALARAKRDAREVVEAGEQVIADHS